MNPNEIKAKILETKLNAAKLEALKHTIEADKAAICAALEWNSPGKVDAETWKDWESLTHSATYENGIKVTASLQRGRTAQVSAANLLLALQDEKVGEDRALRIIAKATTETLFLALHIR